MRLGTRASALALAQARWVAARLGADAEIVEVTTTGDRDRAAGDKSRWVSELERALLDGRIDIAVHSAKDLPAELPDGLELVAIPPRADPRDALCGAGSLAALPTGARIGTSSVRRRAQLLALRQDLDVVELRGNVDTRLRKLADGQADALVLALAGLQRLDRAGEAGGALDELVPAAGQGALALEARAGEHDADALAAGAHGADASAAHPLAAVADHVATACVLAERELVRALGASCDTPVGAYARPLADGRAALTGWAGLPDGSEWLRDEVIGDPAAVGGECAARMLAAGAGDLLARAGELQRLSVAEGRV